TEPKSEDIKSEETEPKTEDTKTEETEPKAEDIKAEETEPKAEDIKAEETEPKAEDIKSEETEPKAEDTKAEETEPKAEDIKSEETEPKTEDIKAEETEPKAEDIKAEETEPKAETIKSFSDYGPNSMKMEDVPKEIDATFNINTDKMGERAEVIIHKAINGGKYISRDSFLENININGIVYGLKEDVIEDIFSNEKYGSFEIAVFRDRVDGEDGKIIEYFDKDKDSRPLEREDGTIDFKSLNIMGAVAKDELISEIIPPTEGQDGMTIFGKTMKALNGKVVKLNVGQNTYLSEDGLRLSASISGHIVYTSDRFIVKDVFVVKGNVDNSTGHINFDGDVIVNGDVLEGYYVKSNSNITVNGSVIGGCLYSRKDIVIKKGINGGYKAQLKADGNITSKFIENTNVKCVGTIYAESIINSKVICNNEIDVTTGKGTIAGGTLNVFKSVKCKSVGSIGDVYTQINIGVDLNDLKNKGVLEKELDQLKDQLMTIHNNIEYINEKLKNVKISGAYKDLLLKAKKEKPVNLLMQKKLKTQLKEIEEKIEHNLDCSFKADRIYYLSNINMKNFTLRVDCERYNNVHIYIKDGEVVFDKS
ncbi:MAG: FapA family protein, partial [Oscillospiraceae bacterium]